MNRYLIFLFFFIFIYPSSVFAEDIASAKISWEAFQIPAQNGNEKKLFVKVTLTPTENVYLYGPESTDGLPTNINITAKYAGESEINANMMAMAPTPKSQTRFVHDTQSAKDTLIYDSPAIFIGELPLKNMDITITVSASGLLCSAKNCTMYSDGASFTFTAGELKELPETKFNVKNMIRVGTPSLFLEKTQDENIEYDYSYLMPQPFQPFLEVQALGTALLFGILAGLLLNLMPCVLPVISLKFSSLMAVSAMADKSVQAKAFRVHCLIFSFGVLSWFFFLALMLGMAGWAWGELFQSPLILCILGMILFLLGLSLFGVFTLPILNLSVSSGSNPNVQAFFSGLLATLLATPCSGPLLGGVLGWAILQSLPILLLTVTSVGVGMALPYIVMALNPKLVHLLPRPGSWTLRLEQFLGFFLMASVVYLITLLPPDWTNAFLMILIAVAFAAWLWGQIGHLGASRLRRALARAGAVVTICIAAWWGYLAVQEDTNWENFTPELFEDLRGREPLLLDFTADWCPSCKALEHTTLSVSRMAPLRKKYNMRLLRVDMTRENKPAKELLKALGSNSLPVLAVFPVGKEKSKSPLVLRDLVTPKQLRDALANTFE